MRNAKRAEGSAAAAIMVAALCFLAVVAFLWLATPAWGREGPIGPLPPSTREQELLDALRAPLRALCQAAWAGDPKPHGTFPVLVASDSLMTMRLSCWRPAPEPL